MLPRREPPSTTPVLDRTPATFWPGLLKALAIPILALLLLAWFGQPALRWQYWYRGSDAHPLFERCLYLTLLDGWRDLRVTARDGEDPCPVIRLFPFDPHTLELWP